MVQPKVLRGRYASSSLGRSAGPRKTNFCLLFTCFCVVFFIAKKVKYNHGVQLPWQGSGDENKALRILHIVTSLVEYDKGTRGTTRGDDRLVKVLLPALKQTVWSIQNTQPNWHVDVYLILGWDELQLERRQLIQAALPKGVGLEALEDAVPLSYDKAQEDNDGVSKVQIASHALVGVIDSLSKIS
jgi:hypothetical protein